MHAHIYRSYSSSSEVWGRNIAKFTGYFCYYSSPSLRSEKVKRHMTVTSQSPSPLLSKHTVGQCECPYWKTLPVHAHTYIDNILLGQKPGDATSQNPQRRDNSASIIYIQFCGPPYPRRILAEVVYQTDQVSTPEFLLILYSWTRGRNLSHRKN